MATPFFTTNALIHKSSVFKALTQVLLVSFFFICLSSYSEETAKEKSPNTPVKSPKTVIQLDADKDFTPLTKEHKKINTADWQAIKDSGVIRIIVPSSFLHNNSMPRKSTSYNNELKLILRFSEENKLTPIFVSTKDFTKMLPLLESGQGDLIVANLTVTESRKKQLNFTFPVDHSIEQLVVSNSFNQKVSFDTINNLKVGVRKNTSFWETLSRIKKQHHKEGQDNIDIIQLDSQLSVDEKLNQIVSGKVDAVIEDSNRLALLKENRKDIKTILDLSKERPIAWAVRKNNPELLKRLNRYIRSEKLLQHIPESRPVDLDKIKEHNQLRLIIRNNASSYFLWKNKLMGFEYDLIKEFSRQQKVNLKVLVANDFQQMTQWLEEGYGDIISAGLIKTPTRSKLPVSFTEPYIFVQEIIVQRKEDNTIHTVQELANRTFHVRKSSSYWNTLIKLQHKLQSEGIHFEVKTVAESMETEEIIMNVIDGLFDLTLVDSNNIAIEQSWHNILKASLPLTGQQGQRWLVRQTDSKLLKNLNKFIKKEYKQLFYNVTYNKYFKNSRQLFDADKRKENNQKISPYDSLIQSISNEYNYDWRLIAAQINKESQFKPNAKSWAGAEGLLQVMPKTAQEMGIEDLKNPENGLRAGIKYMRWIDDQLSNELPADVQVWFTLAAYNAGLGHLKDARSLAEQQGLNPDRWFDHVEKAFLLLSKPQYYKKARYGYVRGSEPVSYVKHIHALYKLYSIKYPKEV